MVWNSPELSLDLSPPAIDSPLPEFLSRYSITGIENFDELSKLNDFINGLEDELNKIQAFKRELPLSFRLLQDAIGKLKEKARKRRDGKSEKKVGVNLGNDDFEKKSWMSSAQLWSPRSEEVEESQKSERGVFSSFREESTDEENNVTGLTLVTPTVVEPGPESTRPRGLFNGSVFSVAVNQGCKLRTKPAYQTARKQRRCWSPELHRRFVDALEKLGGSQVATPKQIRELMQVEGLTNDEVKSHLQKYRLHVRKVPAASTRTPSSATEEGIDGHKLEFGCSTTESGSLEGPLAGLRKCNSSSMEEDEEERSDGHSWKVHQQHM